METLIQSQTRQREQQADARQGKDGAFEGLVVSVVGRSDTVSISFGPTRGREMPIPHPFIASTSWIRSVPEVNTRMLMQNRFDSGQPEALKTLPSPPEKRTADYLNQVNTYRTLESGEHDISSAGLSMLYMGRRGHWDARSGAGAKHQLSRETHSSELTAPTHTRYLLNQVVGEMGDEERLGIVKRWTSPIDHEYIQDENEKFQAERYLHMKNPAGEAPAVLMSFVEGQPYDDEGERMVHQTTAVDLRAQRLYFTTTDEMLRMEIDENGNRLWDFPSTATVGDERNIPNGNDKLTAIDQDVTLTGDWSYAVQKNARFTIQGAVDWDVTKSFNIVAGENALTMDVTEGQETVGLVNSAFLGIQAENTSDGGLTSLFGPMGSGVFLNGKGKIQIQDGIGGGATFEGDSVSVFNKDGSRLSIGDNVTLALKTGKDMVDVGDGLVQVLSSDTVNVVGTTFNAKVGSLFLGNNAAIPAVLGITLQAWLDTHFHMSNGPVPGTPTTPPTIPSASFTGTPMSILSLSAFLSPNI